MTSATASFAMTAPLDHFAVLEVAGPDAEQFLQGQATAQLTHATADFSPLAAFCTPKGRVIANVRILRPEEARYWLVLPTSTRPILEQHLKKYGVFYKADVQPRDDLHVFGINAEDSALTSILGLCPTAQVSGASRSGEHGTLVRVEGMQRSLLVSSASLSSSPLTAEAWQRQDIDAGIVWVDASQSDAWLPQMLNWESLAGISFKKGCYTGQEVVARAHFRGQVKKRLMRLESEELEGTETLPSVGESIMDVENDTPKVIGTVLSAALTDDGRRWIMLAVVNQKEDMPGMEVLEIPVWDAGLPYDVARLDPEQLVS